MMSLQVPNLPHLLLHQPQRAKQQSKKPPKTLPALNANPYQTGTRPVEPNTFTSTHATGLAARGPFVIVAVCAFGTAPPSV